MVSKVPVAKGNTDAVTMMSYGFNPYLSSWSPYHGAVYAVTESIAKITAAGGDYRGFSYMGTSVCFLAWCICSTDGIWSSVNWWKGFHVRKF